MIISIKDNWKSAEIAHSHFLSRKVMAFLQKKPFVGPGEDEARCFIDQVFHYLILCQKSDIENSISIYNDYLRALSGNPIAKSGFIARIRNVFNYNSFIKKTGSWNAYKLCKESVTRTCPYCNQAYAFTLVVNGRGIRPTLDHYYNKDNYPHLALVLNNLIPSCYSCNSGLKLKCDFYSHEHLNPLWDNENISFKLNHKKGVANIFQDISTDPEGTIVEISFDTPCTRSQASCNTFIIAERYSEFSSEAAEFVASKLDYHFAKESGIPGFDDLDESRITRFDYLNYRKYLLGKLFLDIKKSIDNSI